jgi:uncharacterized protein (DUF2147 family)
MPAVRRRRWATACLITILTSLLIGTGNADASPADGTWIVRDVALRIFDCHNLCCGRIVGIGNIARQRSQCGKTIVWGLEAQGPNKWGGGAVLDPDDGKTYRLSATLESDGTLQARIFIGIPLFGRTEILKRIDLPSFSGRC